MAENDIQQTRYDRLMRRVGGMIGPGSKVGSVIPELFPTLELENVPGELLFLSGTKIAMGAVGLSPSVAEFNLSQLFNPVGSGHLLVCTTILVSSNVALTWELDIRTGALADNVGNNPLRDTRQGVAELPVGQIRSDQAGGSPSSFMLFRVAGNNPFALQDPNGVVVLFPGTGVVVGPNSANVSSNVTFLWRERVFEPSEAL